MALWFVKANYRLLMPRGLYQEHFTGAGGRGWNVDRSVTRWKEHRERRSARVA